MRVIFCLPGHSFSGNFFNSWNETIGDLARNGVSYAYVTGYDPVVYYVRNKLLGGNNTAGKDQKPWQGQLQYDRMIWIDSDIVWKGSDVLSLLAHDRPIVSGAYLMADNHSYAIVENLDFSRLYETGSFEFLTKDTMGERIDPFKVSYTGFGFISIKAGVLESMEYPWFRPRWVTTPDFTDFCAEDVGFCWTAQELGHEIWVDPIIKVGHEKKLVLF